MERFQTPLHYAGGYAAIKKEALQFESSIRYDVVWNSGVNARRSS
jgi:hypothetical protein